MFRIFLRRATSIQGFEPSGYSPLFPCATVAACSPLLDSSFSKSKGHVECRFYSSSVMERQQNSSLSKLQSNAGITSSPLVSQKSSAMSCITPVISEQARHYFTKEGRVGWRRKRQKAMNQREAILNPSSPVIDQRTPWPKDDTESLPPELFGESSKELSLEELRGAQNAVVKSINHQLSSQTQGRLFAVIHVNGKQFKVTPGDIIIVQEYFPPTVGDQIRLHKVLLVGGKDFTLLGCPILDNDLVRIEATIIEKTLSYTKYVFKFKKRKNYRNLRFQKTYYTMLRINLIELMQPLSMIKSDSESISQQSSVV